MTEEFRRRADRLLWFRPLDERGEPLSFKDWAAQINENIGEDEQPISAGYLSRICKHDIEIGCRVQKTIWDWMLAQGHSHSYAYWWLHGGPRPKSPLEVVATSQIMPALRLEPGKKLSKRGGRGSAQKKPLPRFP